MICCPPGRRTTPLTHLESSPTRQLRYNACTCCTGTQERRRSSWECEVALRATLIEQTLNHKQSEGVGLGVEGVGAPVRSSCLLSAHVCDRCYYVPLPIRSKDYVNGCGTHSTSSFVGYGAGGLTCFLKRRALMRMSATGTMCNFLCGLRWRLRRIFAGTSTSHGLFLNSILSYCPLDSIDLDVLVGGVSRTTIVVHPAS
ncbi:uncharacterized protein HD556DRAFT_240277 [Suillus plorans]|uniref:Uncharacterized protein n=1 Tax=Suillus plorans TaxID=116603 RepID=A0A9P7DLF2_9AGAM|nr:uncharacterized protein HD556DRAFT_240277 [Suillus plorans]KAG1797757.1 hypothetical protein HD556DRAFT_240277 [Suillus plorans]